jgi:hypothetical protein
MDIHVEIVLDKSQMNALLDAINDMKRSLAELSATKEKEVFEEHGV